MSAICSLYSASIIIYLLLCYIFLYIKLVSIYIYYSIVYILLYYSIKKTRISKINYNITIWRTNRYLQLNALFIILFLSCIINVVLYIPQTDITTIARYHYLLFYGFNTIHIYFGLVLKDEILRTSYSNCLL